MNAKSAIKFALNIFFVTTFVVFFVSIPLSCSSLEGMFVTILSGNPKIVSFAVESDSSLSLVFSEEIELAELKISDAKSAVENEDDFFETSRSAVPILTVEYSDNSFDDNKNKDFSVIIELADKTSVGNEYVLSGIACDKSGNDLEFSLPFTGFNANPARLIFSEVRSKHTSKSGSVSKPEYIEFYVLKGGNTAGLEVITGSDGEDKRYIFPCIEVKTGEYVTVHYRFTASGVSVDELGSDLTLATSESTNAAARDLWVDNRENETRISDSDVIVLFDAGKNKIADAVLYSASGKNDWYRAYQKELSERAFASGVWLGGSSVSDAACSDKVTSIRTLSRLNVAEIVSAYSKSDDKESFVVTSRATEWAVVTKGTPGSKNNTSIYTK